MTRRERYWSQIVQESHLFCERNQKFLREEQRGS